MVITMDNYAEIRRRFVVNGESQRRIAREMGISRNTVKKYCEGYTQPGIRAPYHRDANVITKPVEEFIKGCLREDELEPSKKQHHTAKRIYDRLVAELDFKGGESTVRRYVRQLRGNLQQAFVPLSYDPGEVMQIDWGTSAVILNGQRMTLNVFCARLSYSCAPFVICFRKQNQEAFAEGLMAAFRFFGGVTRRVLFDNARVAVKSGSGKHAVPQEAYAKLAAHYCFQPDFCNARSGNEKGLVENLVGLSRRNFMVPVPRASSLAELNAYLENACLTYREKHCIASRQKSVKELFSFEQQALLPLPGKPFDASRMDVCRVSPYAVVRFETNSYSVPVKYTGREVAVRAYAEAIRIYADGAVVAEHPRCYGRNRQILSLTHYLPLLERKPRSILQAKPVKQALSTELLQFLQDNALSARTLMEILSICAAEGEDAVWRRLPDILPQSGKAGAAIKDTVAVSRSNLAAYDQFIQEGECPCQTPA